MDESSELRTRLWTRGATIALVAGVLIFISAASLVGGIVFEREVGLDNLFDRVPAPDPKVSRIVDEVVGLVRADAIEPSSTASMTAGAIRGVLESLDDPYAGYLDETHFGYFEEQNSGEFFGIGVTVTVREGRAIIVSPIEGTPAADAGLQAEDEILTVDGFSPPEGEWTLEQVVTRVRGEEGTDVVLEIRRANGEPETFSVTITRARIDVPNTTTELMEGNVGYVRLLTFNSKAARDLAEAIEDLAQEGATSFVLDLRDNPGGLLDASVDVASLFIEDGVIVTVEERDALPEVHRARGQTVTDAPLVVLINENTASASEIVGGALQDYERAELVGVQTFGKGSVQTVEELSNGGAIKFTVARYLTPKGRSIHKTGLAPDVVVEMNPREQADPQTDIQLQRAVELARELAE